ncbi:hypothetical protein PR202_ga21978 [Eleusine coracana subsp. coracana]|uniref:Glabrous enhancer-binding protein-like DBD domain-containing protein n=1 Tax=Eleusine coracana subsp. coracana TaxID=191504 RepID=A0AAV5D1U3_ELECO|nr:hypothetical protein PR202_ga21978 [Eleusine coracana subsp. coracana]
MLAIAAISERLVPGRPCLSAMRNCVRRWLGAGVLFCLSRGAAWPSHALAGKPADRAPACGLAAVPSCCLMQLGRAELDQGPNPPEPQEYKQERTEDPDPDWNPDFQGKPPSLITIDDDIHVLEALAAHHREHGALPQCEELEAALAGSLNNTDNGRKDLMAKLKNLKAAHTRATKRSELPSKDSDRLIFDLSMEVFAGGDEHARGRSNIPANGVVSRDFGKICQAYPYLVKETKELEKSHAGLFKRAFYMIDDEKEHTLNRKIKK